MSENGPEPTAEIEAQQGSPHRKSVSAAELRYTAYVVLVIAAIFVVNAMETGSYRTPWPVAIVLTVVGLATLAYSFVKGAKENRLED